MFLENALDELTGVDVLNVTRREGEGSHLCESSLSGAVQSTSKGSKEGSSLRNVELLSLLYCRQE